MRDFTIRFHSLVETLSFMGAILAVIAFVAIPFLVAGQVLGRTFGFSVAGAPEYASYSFAAVSFLGLAYTMKEYGHIRVSFLLDSSARVRRIAELFSHLLGTVLTGYAVHIAWTGVGFSLKFNDISQGHDATPLWIPQSVMLMGFSMLFLLVFSRFLMLIFARDVELSTEKAIIDEEG